MRTVTLADGTRVPAIGQGTWGLGEDPGTADSEVGALVAGALAGATLIDTAEMYGDGASERLVGRALPRVAAEGVSREGLFLVSKVYPWNAGRDRIFQSCEASLERLGTPYLDLYLLHWPGEVPLAETVACMGELMRRGLIRRWGVSNFDAAGMRELASVPGGASCATDQVLYHLGSRGIELELLPWMRRAGMPAMAYCPLAQHGRLRSGLFGDPVLARVARAHGATPAQVLLAWDTRAGDVIAIPKASSAAHARENAAASAIELSEDELESLNRAFPAPDTPGPLDMV